MNLIQLKLYQTISVTGDAYHAAVYTGWDKPRTHTCTHRGALNTSLTANDNTLMDGRVCLSVRQNVLLGPL